MQGNILIIVPPVRLSAPPSRFPLGLGYLAASLLQRGYDVSVLDLNILRLSPEKEELRVREAIQDVDLVAMGGMITMLSTITRLAGYVDKFRHGLPVIVGGPISSCFQEEILKNSNISVLVQGEGEIIGPQIVEALIQGKNAFMEIPGLAFLRDDRLVLTPPSERIADIDALPIPAYHLFPFTEYLKNRNSRSTDIIGSRGCPFKCTFCFRNFGNKVVFRSTEAIIKEIKFLKNFYGITHVHLEDELFVQRKEFLGEFCTEIRKLSGVTWSACARVNTISLEILKEMKVSGCTALMIGIESFSNDILAEMRKGITASQIDQVCTWMNEVGINIWPGLIIGMPGETLNTIKVTVESCIKHNIRVDEWNYAFATPYPGTELYNSAKENGLIKNEWEYIQKLNEVGDTSGLTINLTKFSDNELVRLRANAIREIKKRTWKNVFLGRGVRKIQSINTTRLISVLRTIKRKSKRLKRRILHYNSHNPFSCVHPEHYSSNLTEYESKRLLRKSLRMIEIEVFSFCNRRCWFCPNSYIDRHSENHMMKESLYLKILQNLSGFNYRGKISFSRYNEPLANKIIYKRIKQAKEIVPNAILHFNTNGDYFNKTTLNDLYAAGLKSLNIQVYIPEKENYTNELATECMMRWLEKHDLTYEFQFSRPMDWLEYKIIFNDMKIRIYTRNFRFNGVHRGGIISELRKNIVRNSPCLIPFHDIYIDYTGKVVPCCNIRSDNQEHSSLVLGDLSETDATIFSVFNSRRAVSWRRGLANYGEKEFPCDKCSFAEIPASTVNEKRAALASCLDGEN